MVEDIKIQLALLDEQSSATTAANGHHARLVYVKEIQFQIEIFEYARNLPHSN